MNKEATDIESYLPHLSRMNEEAADIESYLPDLSRMNEEAADIESYLPNLNRLKSSPYLCVNFVSMFFPSIYLVICWCGNIFYPSVIF